MLAVSGLALLFTKFSFVLALPSFVFTGRLNISIWLLMPDPNVFSALNHINKKTKKKSESGNQDKPHSQIAMQLHYCSSHWIVPWVVSVFVITIEELDCPLCSCLQLSIEWSLNLTYDVTVQNKSRKWFTVSGRSMIQASKQTYTRTGTRCNEVTLVRGSRSGSPRPHGPMADIHLSETNN